MPAIPIRLAMKWDEMSSWYSIVYNLSTDPDLVRLSIYLLRMISERLNDVHWKLQTEQEFREYA